MRLQHALIKGISDFIIEDTEEARVSYESPLEVIEGVHLYALNRLETVRRFSQLIQPVSGRHDTYSENLEKYSIAENSKIPMTA